MNIAYLVNQYPKVSHSFIRREILALERLGYVIYRVSIRPCPDILADPLDRSEQARTEVLLQAGLVALFLATVTRIIANPRTFSQALRLCLTIGWRSERGLLRHFIYLAEACLLWQRLKSQKITHIHAHFGTNSTTVALFCQSLGGITYSFTVHGPEEFDKAQAIALGEKIRRSQFVVAISSFGRSQLYRWCSADQWSKIRVVHCGVDTDFFPPHVEPVPDVPHLVCVGRLSEQKGQLLLIEALDRLKQAGIDCQVTLVGDGELRGAIETLIERYHLGDRVQITGWASSETVRDYLLKARALVLPSFAEGLPVVIMEAFALGRPVLSTYVAGIPELVHPPHSGWLIPAGSVEDLSQAIATVLATDWETLTQMGQVGYQSVQTDHQIDREAKKLASLFAAVLSS